MIKADLLRDIRQRRYDNGFLYPDYGQLSIAEVAPTVLSYFGGQAKRAVLPITELKGPASHSAKVVLIVLDGFGYRHLVNYYRRYPLLNRLVRQGTVYPITSVFPSTTPAALTTLHTGLTPQEHGLPEWNVYFSEFDSIIETLPFKTWEMTEPDGLIKKGGSGTMLYEGLTLYQQLQGLGVSSYTFVSDKYAQSAYSRSVQQGSQTVPFRDLADMTRQFCQVYREQTGPAYFVLYWGDIDSVAHEYGPGSPAHRQAIQNFFDTVETGLRSGLAGQSTTETMILLTADHGHVNIEDEDIIKLNHYQEIDKQLAKGPSGKRILPTGSPHDVFLFIEEGSVQSVVSFLKQELVAQAEILTIAEGIDRGLFGLNSVSEKFRRRIGNVLILPYTHYHVWYEFFPDIPYRQRGIHGGLSEDEMVVPLAIISLDQLLA